VLAELAVALRSWLDWHKRARAGAVPIPSFAEEDAPDRQAVKTGICCRPPRIFATLTVERPAAKREIDQKTAVRSLAWFKESLKRFCISQFPNSFP
jgi:hypothetical protein